VQILQEQKSAREEFMRVWKGLPIIRTGHHPPNRKYATLLKRFTRSLLADPPSGKTLCKSVGRKHELEKHDL
jgi:hypothetical protein